MNKILVLFFLIMLQLEPKKDTLKVDSLKVDSLKIDSLRQHTIMLKQSYQVQSIQIDSLKKKLNNPEIIKKLKRKLKK